MTPFLKHLAWITCLALLGPIAQCPGQAVSTSPASQPAGPRTAINKEAPDAQPWHVLLSGTWQAAWPESSDFKPVPVPGYWDKLATDGRKSMEMPSVTYRREFDLPQDKAGAAVEFDSIRWGGEVLVNGQSAGTHDLGFSGVAFDVSRLCRSGANRLEVKPVGWRALPRYPGGMTYIPIGAGNWFGNKQGGIPGEVFLYLYDGARIEPFRVYPHFTGPSCDLTIPVVAGDKGFAGTLAVQILSEDGKLAWSAVKREPLELKANGRQIVQVKDLTVPDGPLWSPASPTLLRARVWLEKGKAGGPTAAVRDDTFGLREVAVQKGRFLLNGQPIALHGVSGVWIYNNFDLMGIQEQFQAYQVTRFRQMNAIAFRGHQDPLPRKWIELCDRHGILIVCEFNNFPDVQIQPSGTLDSPYDRPEYCKNLLREAEGLLRDRFNHPSIVVWSASNEGNGFGEWERANLVPFVKAQDPTRPVMLSSDITPEIVDQHNFCGNWWGAAGDFERIMRQMMQAYPGRLYGCTEYSQYQADSARWYGPKAKEKDRAEIQNDAAQLLMEQTETLRRLRCGLILPFNVPIGAAADWTPGPSFHALRNGLAPMAVSIDYSSRHATAGQTVSVPVWAMSDANDAAGAVQVRLMLLEKHPGYGWDGKAEGLKVLASAEFSADIKPWQTVTKELSVTLPDKPGDYTLATVLTQLGKTPSISLRPLKVYAPLPAPAKKLKVAVLEQAGELGTWLKLRGHEVVPVMADEPPDVIILGDGMLNDSTIRQYQFTLVRRIQDGARLIVLAQPTWNAGIMEGKTIEQLQTVSTRGAVMTLFPQEGAEALLGPVADYERFNGLDNAAMTTALEPAPSLAAAKRLSLALTGTVSTAPAGATAPAATSAPAAPTSAPVEVNPWKPLLVGYSRGTNTPDIALAWRSFGKGDVYACQLTLTKRIDKTNRSCYDPVAERLLARLVEAASMTVWERQQ